MPVSRITSYNVCYTKLLRPAILFIGVFVYFQNIAVLVAGIVVVLFFLNQHKVGHNLAKKKVAREIEKQFPNWLMEVALLLQTDNVQMAIRKSMDSAPEVRNNFV